MHRNILIKFANCHFGNYIIYKNVPRVLFHCVLCSKPKIHADDILVQIMKTPESNYDHNVEPDSVNYFFSCT